MKIRTSDSDKMREHCIEREPFRTNGSLWGDQIPGLADPFISGGRLPQKYKDSYKAAEYAIYSHNTPIAWYGPDGWTKPDVTYSSTTSRHQRNLHFINGWIKQQSE